MADKKFTGSCLCGAVRYEATGEPMMAGHCHCLDCQKVSGAGHATFAAFPEAATRITGKLKSFKTKADSGAMVDRFFCPECGSFVTGKSTGMPGMVTFTLSTMDGSPDIPPQMRVYDKRRRAWDVIDPALPAFPAMPPMGG
jgi:hypothetical protein